MDARSKRMNIPHPITDSKILRRAGDISYYGSVPLAIEELARTSYFGANTDTLSKSLSFPAFFFVVGESLRTWTEYARDLAYRETHPAKSVGYLARASAPVYALANELDGKWNMWQDAVIPIGVWVGGLMLNEIGKYFVGRRKKEAAIAVEASVRAKHSQAEADRYLAEFIRETSTDGNMTKALENIPLRDLRDEILSES